MTHKSSFLTKVGQTVAVLLVTALFVSLGLWQLQRAADLKESLQVATAIDTNVVPLESITSPRQAIPASALNRTISVTGKYIANFKAANQKDGNGDIQDWESAL
jgi:cytochrome oxidase assembly protein ShyY1